MLRLSILAIAIPQKLTVSSLTAELTISDFYEVTVRVIPGYSLNNPEMPVLVEFIEPKKIVARVFDEEKYRQREEMLSDLFTRRDNDPSIDIYDELTEVLSMDYTKLSYITI